MRSIAGTFPSRLEAELAAELLRELDIPARVSSDDAGGAFPGLQLHQGAFVEVDELDLLRARELLQQNEQPPEDTPPALSRVKRAQGILVAVLFGLFVVSLVVVAALSKQSPP